MNHFEYRKVDYIKECQCTYELCIDYYSKRKHRENMLLVYSESDEYLGCISIRDVFGCDGEIQFEYNWKYLTFKGYLKSSDDFLEEYSYYKSILADTPEKGGHRKRFYICVLPVEVFANLQRKQSSFLKKKEFCLSVLRYQRSVHGKSRTYIGIVGLVPQVRCFGENIARSMLIPY